MSKIAHHWHTEAPPAPDVYTTRRNESKYLTLRYWDGESWFEIGAGGRGGIPFEWPKKSRSKKPAWMAYYKNLAHLRNIRTYRGDIQWGEPYKVFDEKEVLMHLVATGRLPGDWLTHYQDEMRAAQKGPAA